MIRLLAGALLFICAVAMPTRPRPPKAKPRQLLTLGHDVIEWIERYCVYPTGELIGQPFRLLEWQKDWILDLFECDDDGNLINRWALLGIPKKNGKSTLIAALAVYHLLGDPNEPDPWAVCAAASDKQADIVFSAAKTMCELSPILREATIRFRWEIRVKDGNGKLERVAASAGKLDGKNISFLVVDELHEWTLENWTILTNGTVGRRRSMIVQITTAGYDQETICYREYEKGLLILEGNTNIKGYLFRWFGAPADADFKDPAVWKAANPSYGTLVTLEVLQDKCHNVPESQFKRYFLNMWVEAEEMWLPAGAWESCENPKMKLKKGGAVFVGWDASTHNDSTAVVVGQWAGDKLRVKAKVWERPLDPNGNPVDEWTLPIAEVEAFIRSLCRDWYEVTAIAFDPAFITWSAAELEVEGLPMIKWPQTNARMCPGTKALYELIVDDRLEHDGDPVLSRHVRAAKAYQTREGGFRLAKGKIRKKIDAAIALVMVAGLAMPEVIEEPTPWAVAV